MNQKIRKCIYFIIIHSYTSMLRTVGQAFDLLAEDVEKRDPGFDQTPGQEFYPFFKILNA